MGYGVVEARSGALSARAYGAVSTPSGWPLARRLLLLHERLIGLLAEHKPDSVAVELLFFNVNVRTALAVGEARGVALLACAEAGCDVYEYTPQQVKRGVVGYGKADKRQMQDMVRLLLRLETVPRPDDAADALGVAVCHANTLGLRARLAAHESGGAAGGGR